MADSFQKRVWQVQDIIDVNSLNRIENGIADLYTNLNSITTQIGSDSGEDSIVSKINNLQTNKADKSELNNKADKTTVNDLTDRVADLENNGVDLTDVEKTLGVKLNTNLNAPSEILDDSLYDVINAVSEDLDDSITEVNRRMNNMELKDTNILKIIGGTEANGYYGIDWDKDNTKKNLHTRISDNENTISTLNSALENKVTTTQLTEGLSGKVDNSTFSNLQNRVSANETNINNLDGRITDNETDISSLNEAIFGSSSSDTSSGSLIDKVEKAMGRSLNLEQGETADGTTGAYSNSLTAQINDIKGVLGMSGGTSGQTSNLLGEIDSLKDAIYGGEIVELGENYNLAKVLDDLYGELNENNIRSDSLISKLTPIPTTVSNLNTKVDTLSTDVDSVKTSTNQLTSRVTAIEKWDTKINKAYTDADSFVLQEDEKTYLRLSRVNKDVPKTIQEMQADLDNTYIQLPEGGGGAGTSGGTAIITRITDTSVQILTGNSCFIEYRLEARDSGNDLVGNGTAIWYIGGVQVATSTALNITANDSTITNRFDISPYLSVGSNDITLQVSINTNGEYPTIVRKTWTVSVINFSLVWNYNEETIFDNGLISLDWMPYGANINKTTHIYIDKGTDNEIHLTQSTLQSGITQTYTFEHNLSHGVHECEMYLAATINEQDETTTPQRHDIIVVQPLNNTPIISSSEISSEMEQYDTIAIPIVVYTPNSTTTSNIILAENGETKDTWNNIDRTLHYWNYSPTTTGTKILTITVGSVVKTITITVNSIAVNNDEVSGYDFKIKASDIVSNTALQNNELLSFSNNFDWINGGLKTERDSNGNIQQYICIKAGTTMTINKQLFNSSLPFGLDFKIILKTTNCSDYDAKILDCYSNDIGIELFAHKGVLKSSGQSITTQYGENVYIELDFEVYGTSDAPRYMMCWVDGVMSIVRVCNSTDRFEQTDKVNITIGSTNADVYIYLVKNYYKKLSINEHMANFIADAPNATTMKARYNRNNILDESGEISDTLLYNAAPDCRIWLYDISRMTTGKKDPVNVYKFTQKWKNGGTEYYDGLYAENAVLTVQGTSSVNYRKGAANTDINFTKNSNAVLRSGSGEDLLADGLEQKGMKLTDNSLPITYSNMKVNFASCEQVNNMCNAMWYQNFQPYPSLSNRDCMEFVMGVQFIRDRGENEISVEDPVTHEKVLEVPLFSEKENRDANKYYMYSIGNLGTSKKNTDIFHSENECCIEVNDNTTEGQRMITWPENMDWTGDDKTKDQSYGMRYPDTKTPDKMITDGWERFVRWMAANNPNAATNEPIEEETYPVYTFRGHYREGTQVLRGTTVSQYAGTYTTDSFNRRMAKMLSECEDYMAMDSVVYHFCFIERHTMVDNVAKNTFWSAAKTNQYINGVEQEDTEGYWIWDLSKNYDNDTSDGNNNEGQLVFDYGNEADGSINGKMVFNASDSVWFVFISHLTEACATMFINRESARSHDGRFENAWNSLSYHNYLLSEQQKVPERVWNECYRYDYLRPYEKGINTSWISFLDGGQKIHQRRHYETFQELYLASKYMSPTSVGNIVTLRGYTPTITDNMSEEQKEIIRTTLAAVPPKSEVTVTMYNKCYLTVHMGNNFLQEKVEKGVPTTLTFRESNGNYLGLMDTVINIDTASMIQEIGDLSPLYPGQSSFGPAYRLRSIKIGSNVEGYQNLNISATETGAFDFSTNVLLERLEIQNLKSVNAPLSLEGCPALKYLDASGSSFTAYSFSNGGLLQTAYLGNPNTIIMENLTYLEDENFIIDNTNNLKYLTIDNCPNVDTFTRTLNLDNLLLLHLLNVDWTVQGKDFKTLFEKIKTVSNLDITGTIKLTDDMGTFNIDSIQGYFDADLKFYYMDAEQKLSEYFIVRFFNDKGDFINSQYILGGYGTDYVGEDYFTDEYLLQYNQEKDSSWLPGADTRWNFYKWNKPTDEILSDLDVNARMALEYRMDYILQTEDVNQTNTQYRYLFEGRTIPDIAVDGFERDFYWYIKDGWSLTQDGEKIDMSNSTYKLPLVETWYALYTRTPQNYNIYIYTTDINGEKAGEAINKDEPLIKKVIGDSSSLTTISMSEISKYLPINDSTIGMYNNPISGDNDKPDEQRRYRYLNIKPYVPSDGLQVTGNMDLLITYYDTEDIFTNYFINKIASCNLESITKIPKYGFNHNTNLTKLIAPHVKEIGDYSLINFIDETKRKIFIFENTDVTFGQRDFVYLNNAIVFFRGSGRIIVDKSTFDNLRNCSIIVDKSNYPIGTKGDIYSSFSNFTAAGRNNTLYVTDSAYRLYPNSTSTDNLYDVSNNLISSARTGIIRISDAENTCKQLFEEAGLTYDY